MSRANDIKTIPVPPPAKGTTHQPGSGVQSKLDDRSFAKYLDGYQEVTARELLDAPKGGRVRYRIDVVGPRGAVIETKYRLGGVLTTVDPQLRYLRLFNPSAKAAWSVQLQRPGELVRLWYMPAAAKDEVLMFRKLLEKLDAGEISLKKKS